MEVTDQVVVEIEPPVRFMGQVVSAMSTRIGAFTYLVGGVVDDCSSIGRYCSIAAGVRIGEADHPVDWLGTSPFQYDGTRFGWHGSRAVGAASGAVRFRTRSCPSPRRPTTRPPRCR